MTYSAAKLTLLSLAYRRYLRSPRWRYLKACVANKRGRKCERCGNTYRLELHHKTYARFKCERLSDVELLCRECHLLEHKFG